MNQEKKVVKISDIIENQIPEFILSDNPNFSEFLKQYYISQEFQGSTVDIAENLISYKNIDSFDLTNLISETTLSSSVEYFDDVINVSSTNGWPKEYGLLKIDDEIITYTGITPTSFTGCIRGFSAITSLSEENNPEFLVFSESESSTHEEGSIVYNLSNLFLSEFFRKIKYQFTPGFEEIDFNSQINVQNFISKAKTFYQTKGTDEAFKILFKVLYAENVQIIKPIDYCFTASDDKWRVVETFVCELVSGDPFKINGQTLYQDSFAQYNISNANGSIYDVESFTIEGQTFYKIQIFSGYSNNLNPRGSIEGEFATTPKTFVVENILSGSTIITVDSTVGFESEGTLEIDGLTITYQDKTNNQFLYCSGVTSYIEKKTKVFSDHYVYSYEEGTSNLVKFKLCNVLSKLENSDVLYAYDGDPIQIDQLGSTEESVLLNSLIYNIPVKVSCGSAVNIITTEIRNNQKEGFSISNGIALCKTPHQLRSGDLIDLYIGNTDQLISSNLSVNVLNSKEFAISIIQVSQDYGDVNSLLGKEIVVRRHLKKSTFNNLNLTANIQDSYVDSDSYYITSNGFPEYEINPLTFNKNFTPISDTILESIDVHYFQTGDEVSVVSYASTNNYQNISGIQTGNSYFVTRSDGNQINLSLSRENLETLDYISFIEYDLFNNQAGKISNIQLIPTTQYNREIKSNKLFKKFPKNVILPEIKEEIPSGSIGIFVNGIELKSYKSFDKVYYGSIKSISILNPGYDYDILNPPQFKVISDDIEYPEVEVIPHLKGKLTNLLVSDSGFDYVETPIVTISGGNSSNIVTEVKMKNVTNEVKFNSTTKDTIVDTVNNKFIFKSRHRFVTGEPVVYKTFSTTPIGIGTIPADGFLSNDSIYYVVNVGSGTSMSLAFTKSDAFENKNLVNLRTYGGGIQSFISKEKKLGIDEVNIIQNENYFEYKKLSFISSDVDILDDIITIENHGFLTGEEVVYSWKPVSGYNGQSLGGLSENVNYYIVKIDDDSFKLSFTKNNINYVNITSTEDYSIYFLEYSPINVKISGSISINGLSEIGYSAEIIPVIKGSVIDASIQKNPPTSTTNFGTKDIINYEKNPEIKIIEGSNASLYPLVIDGKIEEVIVKTSGSGYFNSIEINVKGDGFGAKLKPVISNGSISKVNVINGGVGYASTTTIIEISSVGKDVKLKANLDYWNINDVERNGISNIEDGSIFGENYSSVGNGYGVYFLNNKLRQFLNIPNSPTSHSPIVGWSYDGCPIYGPFAYKNIDGTGGIVRMRSGYQYQNIMGSNFNFIEEYEFANIGTLDEYNGRFCITPEYPNGVYAYFCTLDDNNIPEFPYVIGKKYNFKSTKENFDLKINQTLDFNNLNIVKWTTPYRVNDTQSKYEFFEFFRNSNGNDILVEKSSTGFLDQIEVQDGGDNYQIGDSLIFDNEETSGFGAIAKVSEISGIGATTLSTQSSTISNVIFISDGKTVTGITPSYHSLKDDSYIIISGISTDLFKTVEGFKKINVANVVTTLSSNISSSAVTGLVTSIRVNESLTSFDIDSEIKINTEVLKIIGLDYQNNLLNVLRSSGQPSHVAFESVELLQNKFNFFGSNLVPQYSEVNRHYYFNSTQSVSVGSSLGVGLGNTLTIYPLGSGIPYIKYVQTGGIYLPDNKFNTGDKITYSPGSSTIVSNYGNLNSISELYIIKLEDDVIGIVTSRSHLSDQDKILTYTSAGSGQLHKFSTNNTVITGTVSKNECTVSTASSHGLSVGDIVRFEITSGITTTFIVTYSGNRVLINSQVNPKIDVYYNDKVTFDLSDPSLNGKTFKLYQDSSFTTEYYGNYNNGIEVEESDSELTLNVSKYTPNLYYNVIGSNVNEFIENHNQLIINNSEYNRQSVVNSISNTQFVFNLNTTPERTLYTNPSVISYFVSSGISSGPISKVEIISKGSQYKKLPKVSSVESLIGDGCNLLPRSESIGKIESTRVINTQFICPTDKTLKPNSEVFSVVRLSDNYTVESLEVLSPGRNYITPPFVKLYSSKDNQIVSNFSAIPILKGSSLVDVEITNPGYGLKSNDNKIITTNNTNGFKIIDVLLSGIDPYTVTLTLKTPSSGFSTSNPLSVSVGDEIFVEGISANGNGYNSSDFNYKPFIVSSVDPAYGSQDAATIEYEVDINPGSYESGSTYNAYVTPISYIPKIKVTLKENVFYNEEGVNSTKIIDNNKNSPISNLLKVSNSQDINVNDVILGKSSKSKGKIVDVQTFNSSFSVDYGVSEILGGAENRGYLSSNIQKLSDNDYYQKFSYSLKSKKSFENWNSPVSDISHIAGYKKFSDLSVESVGIGTTQSIKTDSSSLLNIILDSYANVNSITDYDLVNEIDLEDNSFLYTEYLKFNRLKFGQSLKSTNNRVLSIDDISNLFNLEPIYPKIIIDSNFSTNSIVLKYNMYLTSSNSFFGELIYPEVFEMLVTRRNDIVDLTSYSYYFDLQNAYQKTFVGSFTGDVNPLDSNEIILYFSPNNPFNTVDIKVVKETAPNSVGIATTTFGYAKNVEINQLCSGVGVQTFYSIATSDCNMGTLIVGISSINNNIEKSFELSFVNTETDLQISKYAENIITDFGNVNIEKNGSNIDFNYSSASGIGVTLHANIKLLTNTYSGYDNITKTFSKLVSSQTSSSSASIGISTVSGIYGYTKYIVGIEQTVGVNTQRSLVQIDSVHAGDYLNNTVYNINGNISYSDLNFESNYNIIGNNYTLYFNPVTSANYKITVYESSILSPNQ